MAVASINEVLVRKGLLSTDEIDLALRKAEADLTAEERMTEALSHSNRDAACFPLRLLMAANRAASDKGTFSDLSRKVSANKDRHADRL
jgi:hypothetical protein